MVGRVGLEPTALYPPFKTKQNHIKNRYKFPWTSALVSTIVSTYMASVHRRKKSRYWYASFTNADGHALHRGLGRYFDYYNNERKHSELDNVE